MNNQPISGQMTLADAPDPHRGTRDDPRGGTRPFWILNWGLGTDSTSIVLRILQFLDRLARDGVTGAARDAVLADRLALPGFCLDRLAIVTAQTGSVLSPVQ